MFSHDSIESNFDSELLRGTKVKRQQQWPIAPSLEYSVGFWLGHMQKWAVAIKEVVPYDVVKFVRDKALISNWVEIYNPSWKMRQGVYDGGTKSTVSDKTWRSSKIKNSNTQLS